VHALGIARHHHRGVERRDQRIDLGAPGRPLASARFVGNAICYEAAAKFFNGRIRALLSAIQG